MSDRSLLEVMLHYLGSEAFRCKVLWRELTTLAEFGVDHHDALELVRLNEERIVRRIAQEVKAMDSSELESRISGALKELGLDFATAAAEIHGRDASGEEELPMTLHAVSVVGASAYREGSIHIRGITPKSVASGEPVTVVLRGQGFSSAVEVSATLEGQAGVTGAVVDSSCDIDLNQRVHVRLTFPSPGTWTLHAKNTGDDGDGGSRPLEVR